LGTTGLVGGIVLEPLAIRPVGRLWAGVTGWPIVYDQEGDIAIGDLRARGPLITSGPPRATVTSSSPAGSRTTTPEVSDLAEAVEGVTAPEAALADALAAPDATIRAARSAWPTLAEIAEATGLTCQRISGLTR